MTDFNPDPTPIIVVCTMLIHVVAVAVALLSQSHDHPEVPNNVIATMVFDAICDHTVTLLYGSRQSSVLNDPNP